MTLVDFLLARLDEDKERAEFVRAQIASGSVPETFEAWKLSWHDEYDLLCIEPERALAEVEAKRRIIDLCEPVGTDALGGRLNWCEWSCDDDIEDRKRETLRLLALPYQNHPDYQEEWKI